MNKNNRLNQFCLGCSTFARLAVGIALILGFTTTAQAQPGVDNQGYQSNEKDGLYGDAPAGLNPLDLMHRAQQSNGRSAEEFNEESQLQIDNSVSDFKRLQQQRLLEQQQQNTTEVQAVPTINTAE